MYYKQCRPLLGGLEDAERSIMNLQENPVGLLRFTAPVAFGEKIIGPLLSEFLTQFPALQADLQLTNQKLDLVEGGYDMAIRLGKLESSSLRAKKLAERTLHICATPQYLDKYGTPHTISELEHHNCLLGTLDYWRITVSGKPKNIRVHGNLRCNNGPTLLASALHGNGIIQLPDHYVCQYIKTGQLVTLLERNQPATEGIWAIYPENRHLSPKVRMFIDFLTEALTKQINS